jgi:hypothetical protein
MFPQLWPTLFAETASWPTNWLEGFDADQRFSLVVVCIVFAAGIIVASIAIIGGLAQSIHLRRMVMELKRDMLDRGMSSEEIARVVEAMPQNAAGCSNGTQRRPDKKWATASLPRD